MRHNKFKQQREKRYTFFSNGNSYQFRPNKNASFNGELSNLLAIHTDLVKHRNDPSVFILDEFGKELTIPS